MSRSRRCRWCPPVLACHSGAALGPDRTMVLMPPPYRSLVGAYAMARLAAWAVSALGRRLCDAESSRAACAESLPASASSRSRMSAAGATGEPLIARAGAGLALRPWVGRFSAVAGILPGVDTVEAEAMQCDGLHQAALDAGVDVEGGGLEAAAGSWRRGPDGYRARVTRCNGSRRPRRSSRSRS